MRITRTRTVEVDTPAPRTRRSPRSTLPEGVFEITLRLRVEVVMGEISAEQMGEWAREAVERYYRDRGGWVGLGATARITPPTASLVDDD